MFDIEQAAAPTPQIHRLHSLEGALAALLEQVQQMRGLFGDEDGAVSRAVYAAELALFGQSDEPEPE
jgi:hypothetical protein